MTLPPKGRSGRPGRPAASDRAASSRRPGDKSAPRDARGRDDRNRDERSRDTHSRDTSARGPRAERTRDGDRTGPRDGAKLSARDGARPGAKSGFRDNPRAAPRDGARPAPRDGGKAAPRDAVRGKARDAARPAGRGAAAPVEGKLSPRPATRSDATPSGAAQARALSRPVAKPYAKPYSAAHTKPATARPAAGSDEAPREGERIAKLLARAGVASRREVERLIAEGRVRLDNELVTTPATVLKNLRGVSVDGRLIAAAAPTRVFRFHKPAGLITAERDPSGRPTIYNALRNALPPETPRVIPVGRLDLNTEGLLLLTNDGELKRALELPATGIPRTYRARTFGDITQSRLEELIEGIEIDGIHYGQIDANMERRTGRNQWIEMTLTEGKNREVRRVLEHLGLQVSRLLRTAYGPFELADLPRGGAEEVPQVLVERFRKTLKSEPAKGQAASAAASMPKTPSQES